MVFVCGSTPLCAETKMQQGAEAPTVLASNRRIPPARSIIGGISAMAIANLNKHNMNVFDGLWYGSLQSHIGGGVVRCSLKPSAFCDHHRTNVARDTPRSYEAYLVNTRLAFGLSKDQIARRRVLRGCRRFTTHCTPPIARSASWAIDVIGQRPRRCGRVDAVRGTLATP